MPPVVCESNSYFAIYTYIGGDRRREYTRCIGGWETCILPRASQLWLKRASDCVIEKVTDPIEAESSDQDHTSWGSATPTNFRFSWPTLPDEDRLLSMRNVVLAIIVVCCINTSFFSFLPSFSFSGLCLLFANITVGCCLILWFCNFYSEEIRITSLFFFLNWYWFNGRYIGASATLPRKPLLSSDPWPYIKVYVWMTHLRNYCTFT